MTYINIFVVLHNQTHIVHVLDKKKIVKMLQILGKESVTKSLNESITFITFLGIFHKTKVYN